MVRSLKFEEWSPARTPPKPPPPKVCAHCGRHAKRLARALKHGVNEPVCDRCRKRAAGFGSCSSCRRYRPVIRQDQDGRRFCAACAGDKPASHPCPDCGTAVPGDTRHRCQACAALHCHRRRVRRLVGSGEIFQPWLVALFEGLCTWEGMNRTESRIGVRLDRYHRFFVLLDRHLGGPDELTQARLLQVAGADLLRRNWVVVKYLVEEIGVKWEDEPVARSSAERWISDREAAWQALPYATDLDAYLAALRTQEKPPAPRTVRMYLTAVTGLMACARVERMEELTQAALDRYMRQQRSQATNLRSFVRYAREVFGVSLKLPTVKQATRRTRERRLIRELRALIAGIDAATTLPRKRALVARAIARAHGVALERVLSLRTNDIAGKEDGLTLWPDADHIRLHPLIGCRFTSILPAAGHRLAFPGIGGINPSDVATVAHHQPRA